jgi:hypothetical protein
LTLFGLANLLPGSKFFSMSRIDDEGPDAAWFKACCEQIAVSASDGLPKLSWTLIRRGNIDYFPAVSRVRQRPAEARVQFDVYFYDFPPRHASEVTDRMMTPDRFFWKSLEQCRPAETRLSELNRELKAQAKNRVPFLDAEMHPKYIIHRSVITEYLADHGADEKLTLDNLLADATHRDVVENSFVTVSPDATLADAATAMKAVANCRDVFVTIDGTRDTPVRGWLTNVDLEARAALRRHSAHSVAD